MRGTAVLAWLLSSAAALAQERALDISDLAAPAFTVYSEQDGLSDEIWSTVSFDARGFAWAGSASSLARFDGYRWTPQPFPAAHSLVRDLQLDGDGTFWALFESEGLARYDGRAWSLYDRTPSARHRFSELTDAAGRPELWVGTPRGFLRLDRGEWRPDPGNASVPGMPASIERTQWLLGGPREWMGTLNDGLWFRRPGETSWQRFESEGLGPMPITHLIRSVDRGHEELWITSYGAGLARLRDDGVRVWRSATGELPSEAMYNGSATTSPTGERLVWIATRGGLLRVRGDTVTAYDRRHGLPSDAVRSVDIQRTPEGTDLLWLATEGGIVRASLAPSQWRTVSLHGARENGTFGLMLEPDGDGGERLWVGSMQQGLALLEHGQWRYFRKNDGTLPENGVRSLWRVRGPDGRDWRLVGLHEGHVLRIEDDLSMVPIAVPWTRMREESLIHALSREVDGVIELWFATQRSGLQRLRDGTWTRFDAPDGKPWVVYSTTPQRTPDGHHWLWAASDRGLARFDGQRWQWLAPLDGLPADGFRQAALVPRLGRVELWAGSFRNGVVRLDATDPATPRVLRGDGVPPAPDPTVYSVMTDSHGLVHDECNTNSQQVDAHDRYWVGTLGGLSVFDPSLRVPAVRTVPKPLHFVASRVDGAMRTLFDGEALMLAPGTRELRVDFTLLAGLRETESLYRSQLEGYDPQPSDWSPEPSRSFTGLPPGDYVLRLQGRDYAGTESSPRELRIALAPYWWQRGGVRLAIGAAVLLLAASAVLLWNRNLRLRQRQLQREVTARTRQLHDANARLTELSYRDPLTGLANRRRLMEALAGGLQRAAALRREVGLVVIDVDHFKRYNDRHGHLAGDAALRAVAQALQDATREQDLVARFGGEEFACLLLDADRDTVLRVTDRMRVLVEALPPRLIGNDEDTLTVSAGYVACIPSLEDSAAVLLERADAALYRAKRDGRNRVREA